ncbi:MAG TPA: response regulator [Bryobacteraceae bacterium]|jgi:two-component system, cell cycle sensor histidine kinase and response regulator CckA|nr:response regulator [Bryobacteraceae bacterium]
MPRKTILVVDDEPRIRSLVKSVLERRHHRILEASDGVEALGIVARPKVRIDLLLTDIVMPGIDGIELARRTTSRSPKVRVIYMSGECEAEAVRLDMERRGFGFVRKPFDIDELDVKVNESLARAPKP